MVGQLHQELLQRLEHAQDLAQSEGRDLSFSFGEWLAVTLELQRGAFGQDPPALVNDERADWLMMNLLACHSEVTELSDECGWKPWVSDRGWMNTEAMISECADLLHFVGNILATLGCTGEQFTRAYLDKVGRNYARQSEGDDGVSRRCPHCGRSLDDVGFEGIPTASGEETACGGCGRILQPSFLANLPSLGGKWTPS